MGVYLRRKLLDEYRDRVGIAAKYRGLTPHRRKRERLRLLRQLYGRHDYITVTRHAHKIISIMDKTEDEATQHLNGGNPGKCHARKR
jgi:hypothetical protein